MWHNDRQAHPSTATVHTTAAIGGSLLQYVKVFKYLGHMITDTLYDDEDLQLEIRNLF